MFDESCKLAVEVSGEPEARLNRFEKLGCRRAAQCTIFHLLSEVRLEAGQLLVVTVVVHAGRPVVGHHDVNVLLRLAIQGRAVNMEISSYWKMYSYLYLDLFSYQNSVKCDLKNSLFTF